MRRFLTHLWPVFLAVFFSLNVSAQSSSVPDDAVEFGTLNQIDTNAPVGFVETRGSELVICTNGMWAKYHDSLLIADRVTLNHTTGETVADGNVRLEQSGM